MDEGTPLLGSKDKRGGSWRSRLWSAPNRVVLAGFLISLSFSVTQVPLFYLFHIMECDVFYSKNPPFEGIGDRCNRNEIAAGTATQFSIVGMSTSLCGTFNLFVTGWMIKRYGPRFALVLQTVIPAIRVALQCLGVQAGGQAGIIIIQTTQLVTILGGPAGYILVVNTFAGEIVKPMERTAMFGRLQGSIMLGTALGLWMGGMIGGRFGILSPFTTAFCLFCCASLYAGLAMPYISPESMTDGKNNGAKGVSGFFAPLKVLAPQHLRLQNGSSAKHYGVLFLCCGIFLGVLATGYAPILIQMYATAEFGFGQGENGWLMSGNALMRAFFLITIFPRLIGLGRKWFTSRAKETTGQKTIPGVVQEIPTDPRGIEAPVGGQSQEEPVIPDATDEKLACQFDLFFLRWSLVVDGLLTAGTALATQKWHIYLAAFLLPFGSGSAPAAKGVITEMCPASQRTDALNAVTLVENIARLSTLALFGFIFAALADVGKAHLTFYGNAGVAVIGMLVLLLSYFPPRGSVIVDKNSDEAETLPQAPDV
ncbi:hypothetical protein BJ170DRAFT_625194 [Xylariales sp. AK1849]|nr:hypothetical protein BJ170DRAFT_625194 [Xylariales sp. AK1849]